MIIYPKKMSKKTPQKPKKPTKPAKKQAEAVKPEKPKSGRKKGSPNKPKPAVVVPAVDSSRFQEIFLQGIDEFGDRKNKEVIGRLYDALRIGVPIRKACEWVGIADTTYYRWCKVNPVFEEVMRSAKSFVSKLARKSVMQQIARGDGKLALKFLALTERDEFTTRVLVGPTGGEESPIWTKDEFQNLKEVFEDCEEIQLLDEEELA